MSAVIYTHGGGRMGNQLLTGIHLYALQCEYRHRYMVFNWTIKTYLPYFEQRGDEDQNTSPAHSTAPGTWQCKGREFASRQKIRLAHLVAHLVPYWQSIVVGNIPNRLPRLGGLHVDFLDLDSVESKKWLAEGRSLVIGGWPVRCWSILANHEDAVRRQFKPAPQYWNLARKNVGQLRSVCDLVIGVLVRHTDYATWAGGRYFFEFERYVIWMKQVALLFTKNKVGFLISSDDKLDVLSCGLDCVVPSLGLGEPMEPKHYLVSFSELAQCDYILSPPSTFSALAAFIGNIPFIATYEKAQRITESDVLWGLQEIRAHQHVAVAVN